MKVKVLKIGKPADQAYVALVAKFEKRLRGFLKFDSTILKTLDVADDKKTMQAKLGLEPGKEGATFLVCLDEHGSNYSSPKIADMIKAQMATGNIKQMVFVIGGPYGLPKSLIQLADVHWSLSKAVFPSDMAWLMVWEQLYRASTIIRGIPYHHS